MKNIFILALAAVICCMPAAAQNESGNINATTAAERLTAQQSSYIITNLGLTGKTATQFAELYAAYKAEMMAVKDCYPMHRRHHDYDGYYDEHHADHHADRYYGHHADRHSGYRSDHHYDHHADRHYNNHSADDCRTGSQAADCRPGQDCDPQELPQLTDEQIESNILNRFAQARKMLDIREKYYKAFREILTPGQIQAMYAAERQCAERFMQKAENCQPSYRHHR